jgi:hypothetical protein
VLRNGELTYAPLLFALNQTILGYFIGRYIDRSLNESEVSLGLAALQGIAQAVCAAIATTLSPSALSPTVEVFDVPIAIFASLQAGVSGFIISVLFQRLYRRSSTLARSPQLTAPVSPSGDVRGLTSGGSGNALLVR